MAHRLLIACMLWLAALLPAQADSATGQRFVAVAFHDVQDDAGALDVDGVSTDRLIAFFDHIRADGWTPITLDDLARARSGAKPLPDKAILISFDDGYRSLYTRVFPLLLAYRIPVVASLVGSWLEPGPGAQIAYGEVLRPREDFITWAQARLMQRSGLVEFASHSHDQHRSVLANPQGNLAPALSSALYAGGRYETVDELRARVRSDLQRNAELMARELGQRPRAITWPYGRYNQVALQVAGELGHAFALTLTDEPGDARRPLEIGRYWPRNNLQLADLMNDLRYAGAPPQLRRLVRIDPAQVWSPDAAEFDQRLGRLIEQLLAGSVTDVVLQAVQFDGARQQWSAWFPNQVLPLAGDALHRLAWQLRIRAGVRAMVDVQFEPLAQALPADRLQQLHAELGWQVPLDGLLLSTSTADAQDAALALQCLQAVRDFRPELQLLTLAPAGQPHPLAARADLALHAPPSPTPAQALALARQLRASGATVQPEGRRKTGIWLPASPTTAAAQTQLLRQLLREGVPVVGLASPVF